MNKKIKREFRISTKPNLSSLTLFHFTDSITKLSSIIENGLRAYYNYEKLPKGKKYYVAPMVCFCDIPLSVAKYHVSNYGNYGIGINRGAAREAGFTPVFYVHSDSRHIKFAKEFLNENPITPYIKPFLGFVPRYDKRGFVIKQKSLNTGKEILVRAKRKFYDEKEWRLVAHTVEDIEIKNYINEEQLINLKKNKFKEKFELIDFKLFPNLEYIILQEKSEIKPFIENLRKRKIKIGEEIIAKIITIEQIQNDF